MSDPARSNVAVLADIKNPPEVARYICDICLELRNLATGAELGLLAHILDMAVEEASDELRR